MNPDAAAAHVDQAPIRLQSKYLTSCVASSVTVSLSAAAVQAMYIGLAQF
jgi:hypothetical protein